MTGTTFFLHIKGNFFLTPLHCLIKINSQAVADIRSLLRTIAISSASASEKVKATSATSKKASKDVTKVNISKVKTTCSTTASITKCSMSELVVLSSFFIITKYCISFRRLFKPSLSFFISRICIRVILLSQYPVSLFQIISRCILSYSKNLVIISFLICHI